MKQILPILFLFSFAVLFPQKIQAVSITINSYPASISSEIFNIQASISGATNATNYLRIDLYKEGTSNYFGETYNGSDWYAGSDGKSYFPIQIQNSSASATIQGQLGNPSVGSYPGPGAYKLKIRRYTSSGSQSQNDQQTPIDIELTYVSPTPTPTDTPTPTLATTPVLTATPTNPPTSTPTKNPTPTATPTSAKTTITPKAASESSILGTSTESASLSSTFFDKTEIATRESEKAIQKVLPYKTFFLIGLAITLCSAGLLYLRFKRS